MSNYLLTSESVTEGHPDKMCDQVSDSILDAIMMQDPYARVACETATTTNLVVLLGEITTSAKVDYEKIDLFKYEQENLKPSSVFILIFETSKEKEVLFLKR